jgi:hypothetical protein
MIAAANVTSRAVVAILFGTVVAVPLLWKDSGFGEGCVSSVWYMFAYSYRSCGCET